jgi:hypothetical protein
MVDPQITMLAISAMTGSAILYAISGWLPVLLIAAAAWLFERTINRW